MTLDIDKAIKYNKKKAPHTFLCQSTLQVIDPATEEGVHWIARHQESLDDPDWSKEGKSYYDPSMRLTIDGMLGPNTQKWISYRYGPFSETLLTLHKMPWFITVDRFDYAREPDDLSFKVLDPDWLAFTSHGTWFDGMLRLVSGYDPRTGRFSRVHKDWISLDEYSLGMAHYWAETAPKLLAAFAKAFPELAAEAWGAEIARKMQDHEWIRSQTRILKGKRYHQARYNWLCCGWWYASRAAEAIAWQATEWMQKYGSTAKKTVSHFGWTKHLDSQDGGRILAAVTRMVNSGPAGRMIRAGIDIVGSDRDPMKVLEAAYKAPSKIERGGKTIPWGYGERDDRWARIANWDEFDGPAPKSMIVPVRGCR